MKNLFFLAILVLIATSSCSQKSNSIKVPAAVSDAFKAKFPTSTPIKWENENSTEYEAEFKIDGVECSANFDQTGKWLETETEIEISKIPIPVSQALAKNFEGYKVEEAEKIEKPDSIINYEVEVLKGKEKVEIHISKSGEILKKEIEKGDKD